MASKGQRTIRRVERPTRLDIAWEQGAGLDEGEQGVFVDSVTGRIFHEKDIRQWRGKNGSKKVRTAFGVAVAAYHLLSDDMRLSVRVEMANRTRRLRAQTAKDVARLQPMVEAALTAKRVEDNRLETIARRIKIHQRIREGSKSSVALNRVDDVAMRLTAGKRDAVGDDGVDVGGQPLDPCDDGFESLLSGPVDLGESRMFSGEI